MRAILMAALAILLLSACGAAAASQTSWRIPPRQPQVHLQAAAGCPATTDPAQDVTNTGVALDKTMLPPNAVSGLICRFGPAYRSGQEIVPAGALYRQQQLDRATAEHLRSVIDGISTAEPSGVTSCPAAIGSATIIVMSYAHGVDVVKR